jgi:hypothetical protein
MLLDLSMDYRKMSEARYKYVVIFTSKHLPLHYFCFEPSLLPSTNTHFLLVFISDFILGRKRQCFKCVDKVKKPRGRINPLGCRINM